MRKQTAGSLLRYANLPCKGNPFSSRAMVNKNYIDGLRWT